MFWSQEDELRKRFKQIATVVADELAIAYTGNTNVKLIRKGILFVAEYPLFSVGIVMAGVSVAAAAASAVALPIALAAIGTLLPLIMFASFGALFAATAAAMVALTVLGPFLLSFSLFSGMSFVAVAAKAAVIVPAVMIGSTIWAIGSFGLKRTNVLMGEEILGGVDTDAVDEDAKFENINAVGSQDEEDEESTNEFARTILDRFDRQLLGDVDLWDSQEVSAWLKSESLDAAASIARRVGHRTLRVDSNTFRVGIAFSNQLAKRSEEIRERICASQATREREIRLAMYIEEHYHATHYRKKTKCCCCCCSKSFYVLLFIKSSSSFFFFCLFLFLSFFSLSSFFLYDHLFASRKSFIFLCRTRTKCLRKHWNRYRPTTS